MLVTKCPLENPISLIGVPHGCQRIKNLKLNFSLCFILESRHGRKVCKDNEHWRLKLNWHYGTEAAEDAGQRITAGASRRFSSMFFFTRHPNLWEQVCRLYDCAGTSRACIRSLQCNSAAPQSCVAKTAATRNQAKNTTACELIKRPRPSWGQTQSCAASDSKTCTKACR